MTANTWIAPSPLSILCTRGHKRLRQHLAALGEGLLLEIVNRHAERAVDAEAQRVAHGPTIPLPTSEAQHIKTPPRSVVGDRNLSLAWVMVVADFMTIIVTYALAREIRLDEWWGELAPVGQVNPLTRMDPIVAATIPIWLLVFFASGLYGRRRVTEGAGELLRLFQAISWSMVAVILVTFAFRVPVSRGWIVMLWALAIGLLTAERLAMRALIYTANANHYVGFRTLIIGVNEEARAMGRMLTRKPHLGYEVVGFIAPSFGRVDDRPVLGNIDEIRQIVDFYDIGAVMAAGSSIGTDGIATLDRQLQGTGVRVRVSLGLPHLAANRVIVEPVDGLALLSVERKELSRQQLSLKRAFDVLAGGLLTLAALPVMAVVALAILVTSGRPVLFRQTRVGAEGREFTIYKFRTMVADAETILVNLRAANEADGVLFKMKEDPRVTRIGKYLRQFAIDELPQLFNVLKGDMSLVGPRPALPSEVSEWPEELRGRLRAKPGVTGLWQVSGRHELSFEDYMRYDLFYVENWSVLLDAQIVARTVPALLSRRGSY